jgi:HPt (histidine-containing phosphotransfer) domain-containing protein
MPISVRSWSRLALIALAAAGAVRAELVDEMMMLDRAYVPALVLTNQPQKPAAATAESLRRLHAAWAKFQAALPPAERPAYAAAIAESDAKIKEADRLLAGGSRQSAHDALESVRISFWKARAARGVEYYPDRLTAFHEEMEVVVDLAENPAADATKLKRHLAEASALWSRVEGARFDAARHGFDAEQTARLQALVRKEREILSQLDAAVAAGNRAEVAAGAKALKGNFAQTYFLFGDFSGL